MEQLFYLQCLPYSPLRITSKFGPRNTGIAGASTNHMGVDLGADKSKYKTATDGGPIKSTLPGTVIKSYYNKLRGWVVLIDHGTINGHNVKTLYQHLKTKGAVTNTNVNAGMIIGTMGNTGVGAQLHLHFEIRIDNVCVNAEQYLLSAQEEQNVIRYNKVSELPKALQKETQELIDAGALKGDSKGNLNITEDMVRCMIINKRYADRKGAK